MAGRKKTPKKVAVETYKHDSAKRKNIPTAKMAAEGKIPRIKKARYAYSPHLNPELRFDASGQCDRVSEIVEKVAVGKKLTNEEADILRGVAANASQPWLEWSGKIEEHRRGVFEVEPVALHIHERVSANAIIRTAKREDVQADLFADPQQEYKEAIQFYKHDVDWANRLILGDSLEVTSSLAKREGIAGSVQMIYIDPPYGIKFASNFQSEVKNQDVKDQPKDLTREPEMIKAYRDTWRLGTHSYLSYLRDRLLVCKDLLSQEGSLFLQIGDENLHLIKALIAEVFGAKNVCGVITFTKTTGFTPKLMSEVADHIVWVAKDKEKVKFNRLYSAKHISDNPKKRYVCKETPSGEVIDLSVAQKSGQEPVPDGRWLVLRDACSQGAGENRPLEYWGRKFRPPTNRHWSLGGEYLPRFLRSGYAYPIGKSLMWKCPIEEVSYSPLTNIWTDIQSMGFSEEKRYVVQTASAIVSRCMLMVTDPGDLVLDPTCGSGTTANAAESWGRRWITIDSSRVAVSIARQRLLTSKYESFKLRSEGESGASQAGVDPAVNFVYRSVPHVKLSSIGKNENLDPILDEYESLLDQALERVNMEVERVPSELLGDLVKLYSEKMQVHGLRAATEADKRRWVLPGVTREQMEAAFVGKSRLKKKHIEDCASSIPANGHFAHWNVPFDTDPLFPEGFSNAVSEYRRVLREKSKAIAECVEANVKKQELVDQPLVVKDVVRVAGPFTVEGVRPEELSLDETGESFDPTPNEWEVNDGHGGYSQNASAYLDRMLQLICQDGVTFPNNVHRKFALVERLEESDSALHAEALWEGADDGEPPNIAIAFGPQHGPVTASQVEDLIRASRRYDELVIAAFSFDGSSQAVIQESANPRLKTHMTHIRPDISPGMDGLLKDSPKSQLFTVFGQPEIKLHEKDGEIKVELLGVDIYSPLTGEITSSGANKVAAWFLDSDYDGRCFCITQAFFPNQKAWDKIAKALSSSTDAGAFDAYDGTVSVPFEPGEHERMAVKVIDPRGNEVMAIRSLKGLM